MRGAGRVLPASFYSADSLEVAPQLLNKVLVRGEVAGRIVEVEAYRGADDPASHAFRGPTRRNEVMFGPGGRLYVYFTYGMHFCANAVCGPSGTSSAVLLRALAPLSGLETMRRARLAARSQRTGRLGARALADKELASGPARLCQALGISAADNGADLTRPRGALRIVDDGFPPPAEPGISPRIGITVAADRPWRFFVPGDPNVTRHPRPVAFDAR